MLFYEKYPLGLLHITQQVNLFSPLKKYNIYKQKGENMKNAIFQTPVCKLKNFNNLFIELTAKNCNQRCKHCYIDFPLTKNVKDFISIDVIKNAIADTKSQDLECIYLTGAEPMTHPDFNLILRTCLKRTNVCIFTNGTFINEKKARFLRRVEDEGTNEIIFKLSIDHYNEIKNDDLRGRGAFRQTIYAFKSLAKYGFSPILCVTNYYKEDESVIKTEFQKIFNKIGYNAVDTTLLINEYFDKNKAYDENFKRTGSRLDCEYGRILTAKGVYTCPFLANDHRGRCGSTFQDFAKHNTLETDFCSICQQNKQQFFGINFELFK